MIIHQILTLFIVIYNPAWPKYFVQDWVDYQLNWNATEYGGKSRLQSTCPELRRLHQLNLTVQGSTASG